MSNEEHSTILIVDTSMWIDLFQYGILNHLLQLPYQIRVPDFVWEELLNPSSDDLEELGITPDAFAETEVDEIQKIRAKRSGLSVQDASNIVLGLRYQQEHNIVYLAAHDSKLRQEAEVRGLPCKDGLDLLDEMVHSSQIAPIDACKMAPDLARGKPSVTQPRVTMLISSWMNRS